MEPDRIEARARRILATLPPGVTLVAAAKSRTLEAVRAAMRGGIICIGHNYVQEAERMVGEIDTPVQWHMIGHLQRNKARKAAQLFDMVETVDSWRLAAALDRQCAAMGKEMSILVEINSGREASKTGVLPEEVDEFVQRLSRLEHLSVQGLMTMGPRFGDPEQARPYFQTTKAAFERLGASELPGVTMRHLSMGMSNSYLVAIEEGVNMVRIGSGIFGHGPGYG